MNESGLIRPATRPTLPIRLAPIGIDHWADVRYLHARAFERLAAPFLDPREIELFKIRVASPEYTDELMRENLYGAWIDTELTGTAGWRATDDTGQSARITSVYVNPTFGRLGIGAQLLADAEARAEQAGFQSFSLRATPNAVGFFEAQGYHVSSHGISHIVSTTDLPITFMRKLAPNSG